MPKAEHWAAQSEAYNFIDFANDKAYREVNRVLIEKALTRLPSPFSHVDVASGTGLVAQEVCTLCQEQDKRGTIIGIDPDGFAVESARKSTRPGPNCVVQFVQGMGQDLSRLLADKIGRKGVDYASIHDAIHEIKGEDDKRSVLASMAGILNPRGILTLNSAFTTAALEESAMNWGRLKARAFAILGGKRDRKMTAIRIHTPEEYKQMIVDTGLSVVHEAKRVIKMSRAAMDAIARYPAFVEGVFGDMVGRERVTLEAKSRALLEAVEALGSVELSRVWYEIMAQRATARRLTWVGT